MKIFSFPVSYGEFSNKMMATADGGVETEVVLAHTKTVKGILRSKNSGIECSFEVGIIIGHTPSTYYSGNRMYGKYVFLVPENIVVKTTQYFGDSNLKADAANKSLLRLWSYSASSLGFDLYEIETINGPDGQSFQKTNKLENIEFVGFGEIDEKTLISEAMPCNLRELIPGFSYQTQGWRRNTGETHLHAVTRIGETHCFIPFAAPTSEIQSFDDVESRYIKVLVDPSANIVDEEDILNDDNNHGC